MELIEKQFLFPGDTVKVRQLENSPIMMVVKKVTNTINLNGVKNTYFQGLLCRWFTDTGFVQDCVFNTKDLTKV